MEILTINATSKKYGLPRWMLRTMQKENRLPGFYSASRFYVNCDMLMEMLEAESKSSVKTNDNS